MCGIAGAFALTPGLSCDASTVRRMATVLRHRGPDGEGFWSDASSRLCLGHRRLSIIDLATGQQPMHDPDTGTAIVFNGEIYNYVELRRAAHRQGLHLPHRVGYRSLARTLSPHGHRRISSLARDVRARPLGPALCHATAGSRPHRQEAPLLHQPERHPLLRFQLRGHRDHLALPSRRRSSAARRVSHAGLHTSTGYDSSGCQEAPGGNVRYRRYGWPAPFQFLGPSAGDRSVRRNLGPGGRTPRRAGYNGSGDSPEGRCAARSAPERWRGLEAWSPRSLHGIPRTRFRPSQLASTMSTRTNSHTQGRSHSTSAPTIERFVSHRTRSI